MQPTFSWQSIKTILFLLIVFFTQSVSAQSTSAAIEGYWQGQGYELYLQNGSFLMQTKEKVSLSGTYQLTNDFLILGEGNNKQLFRVIQHNNLLLLMGAEIEIKLMANKNNASRNIYLGTISQIELSHRQEAASSQLPEKYNN